MWEIRYGFNPTNASDALLDFDQDRSSNLEEFTAGSNPTNALSVLRIVGIDPPGTSWDGPVVFFTTYSNTSYRLEYRQTITSPWVKIGDFSPGRSNRISVAYDGEWNEFDYDVQRYYRVVAPATN